MKWNGAWCRCRWLATFLLGNKTIFAGRQPARAIYNFCTKSRHVCSVSSCWGLTLGWGDDSCCSELFLLVLLGWKHSPMMGPDVGQLMPNGFQVSSPIMRITAKMPANKTRRQLDNWVAAEYSLLNPQSYLHLGSPHVSVTVLCSAFNAFHNLYKKFISLSFNSSAVELCKRGTFMGLQRVSLSSIEQLMRINMD